MATTEGQPTEISTHDPGRGKQGGSTQDLTWLLRFLADPTRLWIISSIAANERRVSDLTSQMDQSVPAISHHLALLQHYRLIVPRREGKDNFFRLTERGDGVLRAINQLAVIDRAGTEEEAADRGKARGALIGAGEVSIARAPIRSFSGFDRERNVYAQLKADLLAHAENKYVVIVGDEIEGPFETFEEALRSGYRRFGLGPLYVKQITTTEPVAEISREVTPCRS